MTYDEVKQTILLECLSKTGFLWKVRHEGVFDEAAYERLISSLIQLREFWTTENLVDKAIVEAIWSIPHILRNVAPHFEKSNAMYVRLVNASSEVEELESDLFRSD